MKRVMIIGCCGAGKSTLARRLHKIIKLPLYHLDQYYWKENWTETIIYLKYNTIKCLARVTKRIINYHGKVRPDMPAGCRERFDFEFFHYVATYNLIRGKSIQNKLDSLDKEKEIIVLSSDKEVEAFLLSIQ